MQARIKQFAATEHEALIAFTREIIAIPSFCGKESQVIERIRREMEKIGYDRVWVDGLGNCLGVIGQGKRLIALDGHCDTVGIGTAPWPHDPFKTGSKDGIIYGRGAADQKGGLAAAIYAGKIMKQIGLPADCSLMVTASVLEEDYEGLCWKYIIEEEGIRPEAVLLTEPSNLAIRLGQRGRVEFKVSVQGRSCHGSAPQRGDNAIYKINPVIREIDLLNDSLSGSMPLGKGSIAVTDIRSAAPSLCAIPDSALIHVDRRLAQGETLEMVRKQLSDLPAVRNASAKVHVPDYSVESYTGKVYPYQAYFPTWLMEQKHALAQTAVKAHQKQFAEEASIGVWRFSTNGVTTKGVHDIPTIGFGPGLEEHAHTVQDQIKEADLVKAAEFYCAFVHEWAQAS
ncbi:MAG: YgeY family selenium metabolism-linked hydrolase [Desulfobacteraceae bacterium]|nr:MAG: YgeY family selenium metabolism-linked hydrolase [Desulfobacteraceae bacterium]